MKRITFLLPGSGRLPSGGYKVVYEYANRLVKDGLAVSVVYPSFPFPFKERGWSRFLHQCENVLRYLFFKISGIYHGRSWFPLDEKVQEHLVWSLNERHVPASDLYIATAVQTSFYLASYRSVPSAQKYYLIQHFENWGSASDEDVIRSYHLPLKKIVIAEWLEKIVHECGEDCILIHNGFDFNWFSQNIGYADKDKFCVTMLYHTSLWKGCQDGFKALEIVKSKYPQLKVNLFGVYPRPKNLPDWYHYYRKPDWETHNRIYNEAAIFLATSHTEGFGLTPPESMQCGCAVVCTDNGGYAVTCKHAQTAMVSPIQRPDLLAENIVYLMEHDDERYRIAENGHRYIQEFTWDRAYAKLLAFLDISDGTPSV